MQQESGAYLLIHDISRIIRKAEAFFKVLCQDYSKVSTIIAICGLGDMRIQLKNKEGGNHENFCNLINRVRVLSQL